MQKNVEMANRRLKEQQVLINHIEEKMIAQLKKRREKESFLANVPDQKPDVKDAKKIVEEFQKL